MNTDTDSRTLQASMFVLGAALAVGVIAVVLWRMDVIRAPAGILAGVSGILVILAAGWRRLKAR